jgi:hypothetical protein
MSISELFARSQALPLRVVSHGLRSMHVMRLPFKLFLISPLTWRYEATMSPQMPICLLTSATGICLDPSCGERRLLSWIAHAVHCGHARALHLRDVEEGVAVETKELTQSLA